MHKKLIRLRSKFGFTQEQLASNLNIPVEIIRQLESGTLTTSYKHILKIANFFQLTIESLLDFNDINALGHSPPACDYLELFRIYASLDEISKGKLYARAVAIAEETTQKNTKDFRGGWECCFRRFQILVGAAFAMSNFVYIVYIMSCFIFVTT